MKIFLLCFLIAFTSVLSGSEKDAISNFLKKLKTQAHVDVRVGVESMISFESFLKEDFQKRAHLTLDSVEGGVTIEGFHVGMTNERFYKNDLRVTPIITELPGIDCKIFELPFEHKTLKDGRILLLFDDSKNKFKLPMLLTPKNKDFIVDALSLRLLRRTYDYNNAEKVTPAEIVSLLFIRDDLFVRRDIDHSYMTAFDIFYDSEDRLVNFRVVTFAAFYNEILIESGRKLLDKNIKMSEKERKLRALQFYYVKEYLKDPIIKEIEEAYAVAEKIYKKMSEEEIKLYTTFSLPKVKKISDRERLMKRKQELQK